MNTYIGGDLIHQNTVTVQVRLNDKVACRTKLGKTKRNIGLVCAVLKLSSYNIVI